MFLPSFSEFYQTIFGTFGLTNAEKKKQKSIKCYDQTIDGGAGVTAVLVESLDHPQGQPVHVCANTVVH